MLESKFLYFLRVNADEIQKGNVGINSANTPGYLHFQFLLSELATYEKCCCVLLCKTTGETLGIGYISGVQRRFSLETGNDYVVFLNGISPVYHSRCYKPMSRYEMFAQLKDAS